MRPGSAGRDRIVDDDIGRDEVIWLGGGRDYVEPGVDGGAVGRLTICTGRGNDEVRLFEGFGPRSIWIHGGGGRDRLGNADDPDFSQLPAMKIRGGPGRDVLRGADGKDVLRGGPGSDNLKGDSRFYTGGVDRADGGPGNRDRCRAEIKRRCER